MTMLPGHHVEIVVDQIHVTLKKKSQFDEPLKTRDGLGLLTQKGFR